MQQLTLTEKRDVEWLEVPTPQIKGPGEALVRPIAVALCDLDQPTIRGETPIPGPIALGHESVAEVVEDAAGRGATFVGITVNSDSGRLVVTVHDDGAERSAELVHLADRIGALGGTLDAGPRTLWAEIPCA